MSTNLELETRPGTQVERVVVKDIQMTFGSMVAFMVKAAIASIPALIILTIIYSIVGGVIIAMFGGSLASLF